MRIIEMKLKDSLAKLSKEIEIKDSDILWLEIENGEFLNLKDFEKIQEEMRTLFPVNRIIIIPPGYKLRIE